MNFTNRVRAVVGERKPHTWGAALGISKASVADVFGGRTPRNDTLARIAHIERVRLDWLSDGSGSPFAVSQLRELSPLAELLEAGADRMLLLHDGTSLALAASTAIRKTYPRRAGADPVTLDYPEWVVFACTGALEPLLRVVYGALASGAVSLRVAALTSEELQSIVAGQVGNWALFGDFAGSNPKAIWATAQEVDVPERLEALIGGTVRQLSHDTASAQRPEPGAFNLVESSRYASEPDVAEIWSRIPRDRRELALAQLRLLAGETVKL